MIRNNFLVVLILCASTFALSSPSKAQKIPDYDLGGASQPKPQQSFGKKGQYKRVHQSALRFVLQGDIQKTKKFLDEYLSNNPDDEETMYMLGILHGQLGNVEKGEEFFKRAIDANLPPGRLIAGPREMMKPFANSELMKGLHSKFETMLVHGPLLGNLTDSSASFWVRTATECDVEVIVNDADGKLVARSEKTKSDAGQDYTAVAKVDGLTSGTEYRYTVLLNGKEAKSQPKQAFTTMAAEGGSTKFTIAFGGGAGYVPENERMWSTIESFDPDAILLLGDNVYIDDPESVIMQQYTYQRRQSRPEWRKLTATSPVFTIWDDHDFSTNDSWGGADTEVPFWKKDWVFPIFRQNWANPGYGGGDKQPGCWYTFQMGDVDFIMLDCRYYRTSPKGDGPKSMLGPVQMEWLKKELLAAKGTFKVLCSSVPWDFRTKGNSTDTWNGYKEEHETILSFIEDNNIEGVVLVSADRHRSDCWKISRPNGYDLYEFNSSRLTNQHVHETMEKKGAIFSFNKPQSFGLVTFDTTLDDPEVTYEVVDINGKKPHTITVRRSKLEKSK